MPEFPPPSARASGARAVQAACAVAVAASLAVAAPGARADDRDDRIHDLERVVREQAAEQARMRAEIDAMRAERAGTPDRTALRDAVADLLRDEPDLAAGALAASSAGGASRGSVEFGGYFSTRWVNSALPGKKPSFQDMRLVPHVHAAVNRAVSFDGEVEFEHGGVSGEADGEVKVEYAELRLGESECFRVKAGSLLVPWGRFNQHHDDPLNELSSRPTVSRYVGGAVLTAPGVGIEGVVRAAEDVAVHYDVALVNGIADDLSAADGIREARTLWEDDENHDKTVFGRLGVTPSVAWVDALDAGGSFVLGRLGPHGDDALRGYAFDLAAKQGPWELKGEWMQLGVDRDSPGPGDVHGMRGWTAQLLHRWTDAWVRSLPFAEESASVALVLRRDAVDTDDRVRGAAPTDDERAWSVGLNYRPCTRTVIKLEFRFAESAFPGREGEDRNQVAVEFATFF